MYAALRTSFWPLATALALASLTGCGNRYAHERNPSFGAGQMAAAPVVTYPVMDCSGMSSGTLDDTLRIVLEQRGANKPARANLASAPEIQTHLCSYVKSATPRQSSIYGIPVGEKVDAWHVPIALSAAVQKLSAANGAATNVFVLTEQLESCTVPTTTMTDGQGRTIGRVQSNELVCSRTNSFTVRSLVFSARSQLLWSGSETVSPTRPTEMDRDLQALVGRIPAAFGDPDAAATTTTTSAQATVAAEPPPPEPKAAAAAPTPPPPPPAPVAAPEPPIPSDVPIATVAGRKTGFRQSTLRGNSKAGYSLAMLEGVDGSKSEIQAHVEGKLVVGKPMPVTVSSIQIKDSTAGCSGSGTLTLTTLPKMQKASTTPKVLGSAAGTLSLSVQCPGGNAVVDGPIKAELTVQR